MGLQRCSPIFLWGVEVFCFVYLLMGMYGGVSLVLLGRRETLRRAWVGTNGTELNKLITKE